MRPQTRAFLEKSHVLLRDAETMLTVDLSEAAGRTAYLAGFHAAQALIFEVHQRVFKTHSGVRGEFGRLVKDDARSDSELTGFLGYTYQLKEIADYESGPDSTVSAEAARAALQAAHRFVERVTGLIEGLPGPGPVS